MAINLESFELNSNNLNNNGNKIDKFFYKFRIIIKSTFLLQNLSAFYEFTLDSSLVLSLFPKCDRKCVVIHFMYELFACKIRRYK